MKKSDRMEAFVSGLGEASNAVFHPCYTGYFTCFNRGDYYEAHDVLEHLWLQDPGHNEAYFRGLIQIAGAFVHLRKQYFNPTHRVDGRRLNPSSRLFGLGIQNIMPYAPRHLDLDVYKTIELCKIYDDQLRHSGFTINPWSPDDLPCLTLELPGEKVIT